MKKQNKLVALTIATLLLLGALIVAFSHVPDFPQSKLLPKEKVASLPPLSLEENVELTVGQESDWEQLEIMPMPEVLNVTAETQKIFNIGTLATRAITKQNLGDFFAALADWNELEVLEGPNFVISANKGNIHFAIGDLKAAIGDWTKALDCDAKHAFLFTNRSIAYGRLGKLDAATADLLRAIYLKPDEYTNYSCLGFIYYLQGKSQQAIEAYDLAIKYCNNDPKVYYYRSNALREVQNYPAALADLDKSIQIKPTYVDAYMARGAIHFALGDFESALKNYNKALELDPENVISAYNKSLVFLQQGQYSQAVQELDQLLRKYPDLTIAHQQKAWAYFQMEQHDKMIKD